MEHINKNKNYNKTQLFEIKKHITNSFISKYAKYWSNANRTRTTFMKKYAQFMENEIKITFKKMNLRSVAIPSPSNSSASGNARNRDRPRKLYEHCSSKNKKRRVHELRSKYSQELLRAAVAPNKKKHCEYVLPNDEQDRETFINKILAMYMDLGLSKRKYELLRAYNKHLFGNKLYPPYAKIQAAKQKCYPQNISVTENGAKIKLQSLLDHTTSQIIKSLPNQDLLDIGTEELILHGKWGMDGASGQQNFKQKWSTNNNSDSTKVMSDSTVFAICYVPLMLTDSHDNNRVLWKNNRPSSVRFCRPIEFKFAKETPSNILEDYNFYTHKINNLQPSIENSVKSFKVTRTLYCTMIDGKVCNVLTDQKSMTSCNICGVSPKHINDLQYIKQLKINKEHYKFDLSILHCWIRFMECLLHISYNLDFRESCARGYNKILQQNRKKQIQDGLKSQLSITVDVVKQGYGTTNDGNTARRFFSNPAIISNILGINETLIERFRNILHVVTSCFEIDLEKFEIYTTETAELFINLYGWYKMLPFVHKVLLHGSNIMRKLILPIGYFSEEAQESGNKIFKAARRYYSRTCSTVKAIMKT